MTRVAVGRDIESDSLLGFVAGYRGTATTAPTATTFTTDGVNIPVNSVVGRGRSCRATRRARTWA